MRTVPLMAVVLLLTALLAGPAPSHADPMFEPIEIRLVAEESQGGDAVRVDGSDDMLIVEDETLLGPSDFVSVGEVEWTAEDGESKPGFNVTLSPDGARKYERISTDYVGRTLAIMVDGEVVMVPRILDPVRAEGFLLTMNSATEARTLSAVLREAIESR